MEKCFNRTCGSFSMLEDKHCIKYSSKYEYNCVDHVSGNRLAESDIKKNPINHPGHYLEYPVEVIDMIKIILEKAYGPDGYKAYCLGNEIKYRMRAGFKSKIEEDIGKAMKYKEFRDGAK